MTAGEQRVSSPPAGRGPGSHVQHTNNYECDAFAPFALVLCGTRALAERLALRSAEALAQRIDLRYHLSGFSPQETAAYIRHHLKLAGANHVAPPTL